MIAEVSSDASAVLPSPIDSSTILQETSSEEQIIRAGVQPRNLADKAVKLDLPSHLTGTFHDALPSINNI